MSEHNFTIDAIKILEASLDRQLSWIAAADNKAIAFFTINTAMIGVLWGFTPDPLSWKFVYGSLIVISTLFLLVALVLLFICLFPRMKGPKDSILYFDCVATSEVDIFTERIRNISNESYALDLCRQVHRNAQIARSKYTYLKWSFLCASVTIPVWAASIFLALKG